MGYRLFRRPQISFSFVIRLVSLGLCDLGIVCVCVCVCVCVRGLVSFWVRVLCVWARRFVGLWACCFLCVCVFVCVCVPRVIVQFV